MQEIISILFYAGFVVAAIVNDMGSSNQAFWIKLSVNYKGNCIFSHPVDKSLNIDVFANVPHLLKLARNHLIDHSIIIDNHIINTDCFELLLSASTTAHEATCSSKGLYAITDQTSSSWIFFSIRFRKRFSIWETKEQSLKAVHLILCQKLYHYSTIGLIYLIHVVKLSLIIRGKMFIAVRKSRTRSCTKWLLLLQIWGWDTKNP